MKRIASIHITEDHLQEIVREVIYMGGPFTDFEKVSGELTLKIMQAAKTKSIASRSITVTNDKLLKKTEKLKLATRGNTGIFAHILLLVRRKAKHRGLRLIKPGDSDWLNIKEATKLATEFCDEFQVEVKSGFKSYIEIGMSMMKNFSFYKFKSIHQAICNRYEALQEIERDHTPTDTERIHTIYLSTISQKVGFSQDFKSIPEKYVHFIKAKEEANSIGISLHDFIRAQFAAFEWKDGVPDPAQLHGVKSRERVQKYAFESGINLSKKARNSSNLFKKIRNGKSSNKGK